MKPFPFITGHQKRLKDRIIHTLMEWSPQDVKQIKAYVNSHSKHGSTSAGVAVVLGKCDLFTKAKKKTTTQTHTGTRYEIFRWKLSDKFWSLLCQYRGRKGPHEARYEQKDDYPFTTKSPRKGMVYRMLTEELKW